MLIGASISAEDLAYYQPLFPGNDVMRILPASASVDGVALKILPSWTDPRVLYCRDYGVIPFFNTRIDGNASGLTYVKNQLLAMPSWILNVAGRYVYITDRPDPEGEIEGGAAAYKANFNAFLAMLATLPTAIRTKIKCGPVLNKIWTESSATGKGNFDYSTYDPGTGDFFGVDAYVSAGTSSAVVIPGTLPTATAFGQYIKAYKFNSGDTRPRLFPELGLIGMPADTDGSARSTWLQNLHNEVKVWKSGESGWVQPWNFAGWIWWNQRTSATTAVATIGLRRDYPLDDRTVDSTSAVKISPPLPLNKFNAIWALDKGLPAPGTGGGSSGPAPQVTTPTWKYWVGATMKSSDIAVYEPLLPRNGLFRIFPNADGLPPSWDDERFAYCQRSGAIPFVSSNIDGDSSKFAAMKQWIIDMPLWLRTRPTQAGRPRMLLTDRHEPENLYPGDPATYLAHYNAWYDTCIAALPTATRALVWAGPLVTRQWIEGGATKGNGNYAQYDPGPAKSDFYGLDAYMNPWNPSNTANVATSYTDAAVFLSGLKGYKYSVGDARPRVIGELGAIGIPADTTGSARAAWLNAICTELDTWTEELQGWKFVGFSWWNNQGTGGYSLNPIGTARYFYLDKYQSSAGVLTPYASPLPLTAFNNRTNDHLTLVTTGGSGGGTAVVLLGRSGLAASVLGTASSNIPPPVVIPPAGTVPSSGAAASRALSAIYTVLITDPYLNVVGDPLFKWQSLQITLRWKEPGSGQMVLPADAYVREQLTAGARVVVLRRVLGTQHILLSGPIEQVLWEKSDGADDNAGVGKLTVTFVDDMAWLGARVSYPDPSKTPETQTGDYWIYTGNPEQAMLQLVETQAGVRALVARQVPKLHVAAYSGLAGSTTVAIVGTTDVAPREKYEKLTDVLRKISILGANSGIPGAPVYHPDSLGFRVRQTTMNSDAILLFEPLRSRNLSGEVHFSFAKGNLKYFSYDMSAPTLTTVIVGGSGEGSEAFVRGFTTAEPGNTTWGRFEGFQSSSGTDTLAQMQATADQAFAEGRASARLATSAADTPDQRFGIHYTTGDIVSVELAPGQFEIAPVQTVALQAFPVSGEVVGVTIGDQSARYDSPFIARFRELDRRLARVERSS